MKKTILSALAAMAVLWPLSAVAHDFWLSPVKAIEGEPVVLTLGYGHNFPEGEDIPAENLADRFGPIVLEGPDAPHGLTGGSDSRILVGDKPLSGGGYLAHGSTTPLFLTQTTSGWVIKPKDEVQGEGLVPVNSNLSVKHAKAVFVVGDGPTGILDSVVGQKLELVPLANPARLVVGDHLPVRLLFEGKPLAKATVDVFGVGEEVPSQSVMTDDSGLARIEVARQGVCRAMVNHLVPYGGDRTKAENELNIATLVYIID
ncbi:MAG: DUF4198 domain-containing protein [Deltaproteobacteria bacterium]|jgi:uncharacterized GH25 family protein|nr:DUF4198 domain-containing protein [Deltaproteobacteria bacterium]